MYDCGCRILSCRAACRRLHSQQHRISPAQLCSLRDRPKSNPYPHGNSHRLGQPSGIGRATTHALPDRLPLCSVPSRGRLAARIATGEPLRLSEDVVASRTFIRATRSTALSSPRRGFRSSDSLRPKTYAALISLLAATGLRISEALHLLVSDITPNGLLIRRTKFQKTRLVPLHDTAVTGLAHYLMHRQEARRGGDHVFVSDEGQPLVYWKVHSVFRTLLKSAGLKPSGGRWPRIHELRHTFAVRALESSPTGRQRIGQHMLALATYLGHVNINATYWYLETTPELLRDIAVVAESFMQGGTAMTSLAPHMEAFLREHLARHRGASQHTCDSYAYSFQSLFEFASQKLKVAPSALMLEQLDAALISTFLEHLETTRGNSAETRNIRLAAIRSFFRFLQHREPAAVEQVRRVLAIPFKKTDTRLVPYLVQEEMQALLDAPDPSTREGVRDRAMLHLAVCAGLRVSELTGLRLDDVAPQSASIRVRGKGRRERALPLWKTTAAALRAWLAIRGPVASPELFVNARGRTLQPMGSRIRSAASHRNGRSKMLNAARQTSLVPTCFDIPAQ